MDEPQPAKTTEETDEDSEIWASPLLGAGEDPRWFQRFSMYAALGAARSVRAVYNAELAQRGKPGDHSKAVPSSWSQAAKRYEWQRRAEAFDAWKRKEIFATGNALDSERVKKLDALIAKLSERCMEILESIDVSEANIEQLAKLIDALLKAIDLMAKHTGGYVAQRIEHTGKDGGKIEVEETKLNVVFYVPDVASLEEPGSDATLAQSDQPGEPG